MAITGFQIRRERGITTVTLEAQGMPVISLSNYILLVNALTSEALRQDVGAVVLTGTPGKFLFGMDISEIGHLETPEATRGMTAHVQDLLNRMEAVTAPIICAVDGDCFGGGLELVLACHAVFATQDSTFALPEIKIGTIPSFGGTQRLARIIGRNRALNVMLSGTPFSAQNALDWGLVSGVFSRAELVAKALTFAEGVASLSRPAVSAVLGAALSGLDGPLGRGLSLESACSSSLAGGADLREGIKAFFEKRSPKFPSATTS
jgi:enoyl-CoA hydratase/carnithine racemase